MDEQNKPKMKKIGTAQKVETDGKVEGIGPVDNMGQYADRKKQEQDRPAAKPVNQSPVTGGQRPSQSGNAVRPGVNSFSFQGQRPSQTSASTRPGTSPFSAQRPGNTQRPGSSTQRPNVSSVSTNASGSGTARDHSQTTRASGSSGLLGGLLGGKGGGSLILIAIIVIAVIFIGPKLLGGGNNNTTSDLGNTLTGGSNSSSIVGTLLNTFMGSNSTSTYDFSGGNLLSSVLGGNSNSGYNYGSSGLNTPTLNTSVADGSRNKFVNTAKAKNITIMVYMCGTDLESQSGMATADVQEMIKAGIGDNVNLLIYTGGCSKWRNTKFSGDHNQIYRIRGNSIDCLVENDGSRDMTDPSTLQRFIEYGYRNYKADRMCLILWDHGGGSVSGYGYDEKVGRGKSMTLAGIKTALENSVNTLKLKDKEKFDFIGFDACLMATVENGLMLSNYADYMIASEETEPGVGWYYTNWLKKLSDKPGMATIEIGKNIADDFVEVCAQQCRGQATTLSVVDLAELGTLFPAELGEFSVDTANMIQNKKQYKTVASARSSTKEFAQSSGIDQIDLYDFAEKLGTDEGKELKSMIESAVKYNRTGGGISNAHGLSIYFPYKKAGNVKKAVSTYQDIDMGEEYTRCIQAFASLESSGQVAATGNSYSSYYGGGTQQQAYPSLMDSLLGGATSQTSSAYGSDLSSLLGSMIGGGSGNSLFDLLGGRTITEEEAAEYVNNNHIDDRLIQWEGDTITLPGGQMDMITGIAENLFIREKDGYLDLGMIDKDYVKSGDSMTAEFDQSWFAFTDGNKITNVAYYFMYYTDNGGMVGYVPALLTDQDHPEETYVRLIIYTDEEGNSMISGAQIVYQDEDDFGVEAKNAIGIGKGTRLQFVCSKYDDQFNYISTYRLKNSEIVIDENTNMGLADIAAGQKCMVAWCMTDIYNVRHWTPSVEMMIK